MLRLMLFSFIVSCSHMDKINSVGNLLSDTGSPASEAWKDLPRSINDFLYADISPVMVDRKSQYEYQVDENLDAINKGDNCYGPNGKKLNDDSLCKEVTRLVLKVKDVRSELMALHKEKVTAKDNDYYQGTVAEAIEGCTSDLQALREGESLPDRLAQIRQCKPLLTSYLKTLSKKSDEVRNHPRATDLDLSKFDAFYFLNTGNNEEKVRSALNLTSKEQVSTITAKMKSEQDESFWASYCTYLETLNNADEVIENEPSPIRKKRLMNEKKGLEILIPKLREEYRRKHGTPVDDSTCSKYL